MSLLFEPLTLRDRTFRNRIFVAPMCQYSCDAQDGLPTDWHLAHLGSFAIGGFGLVLTEATAVSPDARISPQDTGLWNDEQADVWRRIVDLLHGRGAAAGVQLAHAGRKGSRYRPFLAPGRGAVPAQDGGWATVGPTGEPHPGLPAPRQLTAEGIAGIVGDFRASARRAADAGFDVIELHGGHGYLIHQFLSPLSNTRTDSYGGDLDGRSRLLREIVTGVREVWSADRPLFLRISGTDWAPGGWTVQDSADLAVMVSELGVDLIDVSSGSLVPDAQIPVGPGYQVPLAAQVRRDAKVPTGAVGLITAPAQAEQILRDGSADAVLLARAALREPGWPLRAARELGVSADAAPYQPQYRRAAWS